MSSLIKFLVATFCSGFGMWITAGLWHNLVLPNVNKDVHPHHEGLGLMLVAYFMLAALTAYLYTLIDKGNRHLIAGIKLGALIGIIWVFPHGLAMVGVEGGSVSYEIKNGLWHIIEQGVGGMIIAFVYGRQEARPRV